MKKISSRPFYYLQKRMYLHSKGEKYVSQEKTESLRVYAAPEIEELLSLYKNKNIAMLSDMEECKEIWSNYIKNKTDFSKKYFALIPMFFESRFSQHMNVRFVVKMDLLPEKKALKITSLEPTGLVQYQEILEDVVPVTPEDHLIKKRILRSAFPDFVDGDMLFINKKSLGTICFDKQGTWYREGLDHDLLLLKNSYKENNWFNHFYWENHWV